MGYVVKTDAEQIDASEHLGLVRRVLKELSVRHGSEYEDLYSVGVLALAEAAASFNPSKGAAFSTWAWRQVRWRIQDELTRLNRFRDAGFQRAGYAAAARVADPQAPEPDAEAAAHQVEDMIDEALAEAPDTVREVTRAVVAQGLTTREAATRIGLSHGTCARRRREARAYLQRLRVRLADDVK